MVISLNLLLLSMNSTNETLLFDRFLIMYDLCVFTCIILIFVFRCTHARMSYVLNSYLLTYLLDHHRYILTCSTVQFHFAVAQLSVTNYQQQAVWPVTLVTVVMHEQPHRLH